MTDPRIALISATPLAIGPAAAAIAAQFPEGTVWNLLDDRLLADAQGEGGITAPLAARMDQLIELAIEGGADGVLLTCSQYGVRAERRDPAVDGIAVLAADGPLFAEVVGLGAARVLLLASLDSAASDSSARLGAVLSDAGVATTLETVVVPAAAKPLPEGELIEALAAAIDAAEPGYDAIVLAQFSLAPAAAALAERFGVPVLDAPRTAASRLAAEIAGQGR